jgi:ribosomal protein S18 acetylase RimI-like enzyme
VGFGSCGPARDASLNHAGEIYTLYVLPDFHDLGIGRRLLRGLFDRLATRGMDSALVWVLADNPSRFFYESMGGRRVAERDERVWGTVLTEAAYGWTDFRILGVRHDAQRRKS